MSNLKEILADSYGSFFESELIEEILEVAFLNKVQQGDLLININDNIKHMPLVISGAIKILREDNDGDELLLYFLERGDTCAMTMTCCIGNATSEIRAIAESDTTLLMIPVQKMSEWIAKYSTWRTFVFESYNSRLKEMLEAIDSLAFLNMHDRLFKYLIDKVKINGTTTITNTHQEIAYDLNSSRVVISRLLKQLEKEGKLKLFRNKIEVEY
jgi:CRP/FNR family transcriptional regulator, anaerobic regulatory protein